MANWYVYSGAVGTASGADWTNAKTTLAAAITASAAGDTFFIANDHAETQATTITLTFKGTASSPNFAYSVSRAGSVPPVSADLTATSTISATAASNIAINGYAYIRGGTFNVASGSSNGSLNLVATGAPGSIVFDTCTLVLNTTSSSPRINLGLSGGGTAISHTWRNTVTQFGAVGQGISVNNTNFVWENTASAIAGSVPTTLFSIPSAANGGLATLRGVDLSAATSGKTIVGNQDAPVTFVLQDCKLGASVTVASTPAAQGSNKVIVIRADSGATNYRTEKYGYEGTQTVETTIIHTGGASDGTTPIAWKLVTTANSKWVLPFEPLPIGRWFPSDADTALGLAVGSPVTVTLYGIWGGGAVPNNDDIWMDVEYLGASANPQGSFISASKADNLATGSALTTDGSTWGGSTTAFKMSVTFTPQQKGTIYVYVKAAKASSTFYIDPKPVLS